MLKNVPKLLTGDILKVLCDMGHDDVLIIADANFPGESISKYTSYGKLIRLPGKSSVEIYEAVNDLFPADFGYTEFPVCVMALTDGDKAKGMPEPEIWEEFRKIMHKDAPGAALGEIERFEFYERAKKAYAVIQSGEERQYGNLLIVKGCVV